MSSSLDTVVFVNRQEWRRWLAKNHKLRKEVWLVLPKKAGSGTSYRVYYNEALEEAICFGWIDSRIRSLGTTRSKVRFTPRKSKNWSSRNIEKARELIRKGKMTPAGLKALPRRQALSKSYPLGVCLEGQGL